MKMIPSAELIVDAINSLTGRKKEEKKPCSYRVRKFKYQRIIILDCKICGSGSSTITDPICRKNIFQILNSEPAAGRLVLSHLFERDYEMENLDLLYLLARFINNINSYKNSDLGEECKLYNV
ncbi:MAG TPA: type VI secretion protein, partial [Candidatus Methylomirabilis sp.]|nr:type VI secretion protein [Candidatus Methylomirabilis sp.]